MLKGGHTAFTGSDLTSPDIVITLSSVGKGAQGFIEKRGLDGTHVWRESAVNRATTNACSLVNGAINGLAVKTLIY